MQIDVISDEAKTEIGSYFVANYPPFSIWSPTHVASALERLHTPAANANGAPVGLYIHIPFCRKRCKFCYFRVYTDKNSRDVEVYLDALAHELELYADCAALHGRTFEFVYFGGGTPSFLSSEQLQRLVERISQHWSWNKAREVTFECEPGTLKKNKLQTIKDIGVTRLSLGIEHFDDQVLELNGRAHKSPENFRAYDWAREVGFDQINIDLIAGMVGDSEAGWKDTVTKALEFQPDSITIYQMEIPHNTVIAREFTESGSSIPVADWATKREWVDEAFRLFQGAGYIVSSAYTLVKPSEHSRFVYRDAVWHGADMIGTGVASFSHLSGIHYQNTDSWRDYLDRLDDGELPIARALPITDHQRLIRELILQLKLGHVATSYFREKFDVDVTCTFAAPFDRLVEQGFAIVNAKEIVLTRAGLLRVDALLPYFFEPQFRSVRYT